MKVGILHIASATMGALLVAGASLAQQTPELIVEAPRLAKATQADAMGRKVPTFSIVYRVSYSDLNLATHSGAVELHKRLTESAAKACEQLVKLYPDTQDTNPPCAKVAAKNAMAQADKLIADAEKASAKP